MWLSGRDGQLPPGSLVALPTSAELARWTKVLSARLPPGRMLAAGGVRFRHRRPGMLLVGEITGEDVRLFVAFARMLRSVYGHAPIALFSMPLADVRRGLGDVGLTHILSAGITVVLRYSATAEIGSLPSWLPGTLESYPDGEHLLLPGLGLSLSDSPAQYLN